MKKFVAMIMVAVMCCFMLASCGDSKYVGKYSNEMGMNITLEKDHKAKISYGDDESDADEVSWEVKDKKIILKDASGEDDTTLEFDIVDKETISLTESGVTLSFKKEK